MDVRKQDKDRNLTDSNKGSFDIYDDVSNIGKEQIKIPSLEIKELNLSKVVICKKLDFYFVLGIILSCLIIPATIDVIYKQIINKMDRINVNDIITVSILIVISLIILFYTYKNISPIKIDIDKLRGVVRIKRLVFNVAFPISQLKNIEISDMVSGGNLVRKGDFYFYINARLKNGKKHQLFYTVIKNDKAEVNKVFEEVFKLSDYISKVIDVLLIDKTVSVDKRQIISNNKKEPTQ